MMNDRKHTIIVTGVVNSSNKHTPKHRSPPIAADRRYPTLVRRFLKRAIANSIRPIQSLMPLVIFLEVKNASTAENQTKYHSHQLDTMKCQPMTLVLLLQRLLSASQ